VAVEKRRLLGAALLATCLVLGALSLVQRGKATTDPGQGNEYVFVKMTDTKIVFTGESAYCCDAPGKSPGTPRAWATLAFRVTNDGTLPHNFSLMGQTTGAIPPGKTVNTAWYHFNFRGRFTYRSTLNPRPSLRGIWTVY
jgi:hypothetical protein